MTDFAAAPTISECYDSDVFTEQPGSSYELLQLVVTQGSWPRSAEIKSYIIELQRVSLVHTHSGKIFPTEKGKKIAAALEKILPMMARGDSKSIWADKDPAGKPGPLLEAAQLLISARLKWIL